VALDVFSRLVAAVLGTVSAVAQLIGAAVVPEMGVAIPVAAEVAPIEVVVRPGGYEEWAASRGVVMLRDCESSGRYDAVSPGGAYRGAYQFDLGTWASVGGSGDPAVASRDEQDYRAWLLWSDRGAQPWPTCGRWL